MKAWLQFALFLVVGLGTLVAGLVYTQKEKSDPGAVKIYRVVTLIGVVVTVGAVLSRVMA